jgi:hypothetical protein
VANGEVSADEAREMLNGWQEANARGECEAPHHRYDTEMTVCMCGPCSAKFSAHNSGGIAAPDLAATVIALHERVAELTAQNEKLRGWREECDGMMVAINRLTDDVERLTAERDAAREIVAGRITPPTDDEIAAHFAAGGAWTVGGDSHGFGGADVGYPANVRQVRDAPFDGVRRWWPRGRDGRPCAWPVTP